MIFARHHSACPNGGLKNITIHDFVSTRKLTSEIFDIEWDWVDTESMVTHNQGVTSSTTALPARFVGARAHPFTCPHMRKSACFLAILLSQALSILPCLAAPATDQLLHFKQPNGIAFDARLYGDEFFHWYADATGRPIVYDTKSKWWTYMDEAAEGIGPASRLRVGIEAPPA